MYGSSSNADDRPRLFLLSLWASCEGLSSGLRCHLHLVEPTWQLLFDSLAFSPTLRPPRRLSVDSFIPDRPPAPITAQSDSDTEETHASSAWTANLGNLSPSAGAWKYSEIWPLSATNLMLSTSLPQTSPSSSSGPIWSRWIEIPRGIRTGALISSSSSGSFMSPAWTTYFIVFGKTSLPQESSICC